MMHAMRLTLAFAAQPPIRCMDRSMLWVSTRKRFCSGDPAWNRYIAWIALPHLREVRTLDAALNECVEDCGSLYCEPSEVASVLGMLPVPTNTREYYLLGQRLESESPAIIDGFDFLGCDLCDETMTSSVLNCGPWEGCLAPLVARLNSCGLLSADDAREAQRLLPLEWGADEPHANVDIWTLYGQAAGTPVNSELSLERKWNL